LLRQLQPPIACHGAEDFNLLGAAFLVGQHQPKDAPEGAATQVTWLLNSHRETSARVRESRVAPPPDTSRLVHVPAHDEPSFGISAPPRQAPSIVALPEEPGVGPFRHSPSVFIWVHLWLNSTVLHGA
jgi:hypothetical protein